MSGPLFQRMALIGVGLIGSSLARATRARNLVGEITGHARSAETRARLQELGICDSVHDTAGAAVEGADLVMICTPVAAIAEVGAEIAPSLAPKAIVSDVGSTKASVIHDLAPLLPEGVQLVPGHPVAGTEHSGPDAGFAEIFEDRWCILTPPPETGEAAVEKVAALWRGCGSMVEVMSAQHHDKVLAVTSHLPHLIAYTIVGTASDLEADERAEVIKFSASGFRDFTRIAASDPTMWRDVFLNNREAVLEMLQRFNEDLSGLQRAIRRGEGEALFDYFTHARGLRRGVVEAGQAGSFDPREPHEDDPEQTD